VTSKLGIVALAICALSANCRMGVDACLYPGTTFAALPGITIQTHIYMSNMALALMQHALAAIKSGVFIR
jgi:hypothetical protein